jgi:DNA replication protein DnaC
MTSSQAPRGARDGQKKKVVLERPWLAEGPLPKEPDLKVPLCAIKQAQPCCGGRGYQVVPKGATAHAMICKCVEECAACAGRAHRIENDLAKPCKTPPPPLVVNLINSAHIPARYADASLEKFTNFSGNGRQFLADLSRWRSKFAPDQGKGLIIEGPVGVGKTYLLAALAKEFCAQGQSVRFIDFFHLLGELRSGFSQGKADAAQLAPIIDVDVLIIDELGKGRNSDWELTVLDQLVCGRYNQQRTIIASTNYRLKGKPTYSYNNQDLERGGTGSAGEFASDKFDALEQRIGPRIFSRLKEMTMFVELSGDDYRRREP